MAEDFIQVFDGVVKDIAMQVVSARLQGVLNAVNVAKSKYGKELAETGIGTNAPPFFAPSGSWKPLGDAWLKRKKASSSNPRFYEGLTGKLRDDILAMPTERIFGKTRLNAGINVRKDDTGFFNPRIKRRIDTVYRSSSGRFASPKLAGVKRFTVRIDPFPELAFGTSSSRDYINKLPLSALSKMKLNYNDPQRPLLVGFTEWFADHRIKFAAEQALREVFK